MYHELVMALTFGIAGYLVAVVLTQPGEVLHYLPGVVQFLNRSSGKSPMDWNAFQHWSNKITWNCSKCIAGFWALIYSLTLLSIGQGFICVVLAIFTAYAIEKWLN